MSIAEALAKTRFQGATPQLAQGDGELGCGEEVSAKNLKVNMENFSRTLDKKYFTNAVEISGKLG